MNEWNGWLALVAFAATPAAIVLIVAMLRGYNMLVWRDRKTDPTPIEAPGDEEEPGT